MGQKRGEGGAGQGGEGGRGWGRSKGGWRRVGQVREGEGIESMGQIKGRLEKGGAGRVQ